MCASPLSPRHAQPDWMGGGLVSRQMTPFSFSMESFWTMELRVLVHLCLFTVTTMGFA